MPMGRCGTESPCPGARKESVPWRNATRRAAPFSWKAGKDALSQGVEGVSDVSQTAVSHSVADGGPWVPLQQDKNHDDHDLVSQPDP
jgi:hypothetical protein